MVDQFGKPVERPLCNGDVTITAKDSSTKSSADYAHLWLDLEDRERHRWIDTPGFGEGNKFDNYIESMLEKQRILPVTIGTQVKIIEVKPSPKREYFLSYFKVEVLRGPYEGKIGWLSYFGLEHP